MVAIPKSASTALLTTLGDRHELRRQQITFPGNPWPKGYTTLARWHSDGRELLPEQVERFGAMDALYKQHVLPTRGNLKLLADVPKVVLLRDPTDVVRAYRRAQTRGLPRSTRREFAGLEDEPEDAWIRRARDIGLMGELRRFARRWRRARRALQIDYEDLVGDTDRVFDEVEDFLSLARSPRPVQLNKERYSREPATG